MSPTFHEKFCLHIRVPEHDKNECHTSLKKSISSSRPTLSLLVHVQHSKEHMNRRIEETTEKALLPPLQHNRRHINLTRTQKGGNLHTKILGAVDSLCTIQVQPAALEQADQVAQK